MGDAWNHEGLLLRRSHKWAKFSLKLILIRIVFIIIFNNNYYYYYYHTDTERKNLEQWKLYLIGSITVSLIINKNINFIWIFPLFNTLSDCARCCLLWQLCPCRGKWKPSNWGLRGKRKVENDNRVMSMKCSSKIIGFSFI